VKKRRESPFVQVKMRMREPLWRRLTAAANSEERTLSAEIVSRLESSYRAERDSLAIEQLMAPGAGLELIRSVGVILRSAGKDWNTSPEKSRAVSEAIAKVVAVLSGELRPVEESFPKHAEKFSADYLGWLAVLVGRFFDHLEGE
jgi:hypothetical protein